MKLARIHLTGLGLLVFAAGASATPPVTGAIFKPRVENLGPATTLTMVNSHPGLLSKGTASRRYTYSRVP